MVRDLTKLDTHFFFGENWASYAKNIGEQEISDAAGRLQRRLGGADLKGQRFLDIGCGSGVHSLAALRLGASEVVAVDLDPDSVFTARMILAHHAPNARTRVEQTSVFDMAPGTWGTFDVVYSWGVLHHTGDMEHAIRMAAALVAEGGQFLFALYRRTWACAFWKWEKRWYSTASSQAQKMPRSVYVLLFRIGLMVAGRSFTGYVETYKGKRGMDFYHDVHDWMGGVPYESISAEAVDQLMQETRMIKQRCFIKGGFAARSGLLGSGCDEYVYLRS